MARADGANTPYDAVRWHALRGAIAHHARVVDRVTVYVGDAMPLFEHADYATPPPVRTTMARTDGESRGTM